jgi:hypothetical protein
MARKRGEEPRLGTLFLVLAAGTFFLMYQARQAVKERS